MGKRAERGERMCFNPTLVRLRPCLGLRKLSCESCFNPTLVRLRHGLRRSSIRSMGKFQSHAGSIEACDHRRHQSPDGSQFQSHAGSIEAFSITRTIALMASFQSHAGSIEATMAVESPGCARRFQSHAGSIEARRAIRAAAVSSLVSIPRWFD